YITHAGALLVAYGTSHVALVHRANLKALQRELSITSCLARSLLELDSMDEDTRLFTLIEGVLAANIFDSGLRARADLYHKETTIKIYRMSHKKMQWPWWASG
nr:pantothenate kinase 2 [Tanacetum cinerariifolium]